MCALAGRGGVGNNEATSKNNNFIKPTHPLDYRITVSIKLRTRQIVRWNTHTQKNKKDKK